MKIFFDHQTFSLQNYGGISRYYVELIKGLNKLELTEAHLSLLYSENVYLPAISFKTHSLPQNIALLWRLSAQYRINKLYSEYEIKKTQFDIFHATYYDPYFVKSVVGKPIVVTFLDMIHERYAREFADLAADKKITKRKKAIAEAATSIIAISESTKRDIVELLDVPEEKIKVIHLGSSISRLSPVATACDTGIPSIEPYLLYVGNRENYKNFKWFMKSVAPLLRKFGLKTICAGGGPFTPSEIKLIDDLGLINKVLQQPITDILLEQLYRNAVAFVFPSLYEGFGLPVLEAFACDCPCIVSNVSSLPEVAGNAALYIEPNRPESLQYAVERVFHDNAVRYELIKRGREQLSRFSWINAVDQTHTLYKSII